MDTGAQLWPEGPSFLFLLLMSSLFICPTVQGADHDPILAVAGSNVLLPCQAPKDSNQEDLVLEWTRADLKDYVFMFKDGLPFEESQYPDFRNRTELTDPTLHSGDLTLKLHLVEPTDTGLYQCHVNFKPHARRKRSMLGTEPISTVNLTVVTTGHDSIKAVHKSDVLLPCEVPKGSNLDHLVLEWTRSDLHQDNVFLFRDGRPVNNSQCPHFRNRVKLIDPTLRSGDLTLKLHHVGPTDQGQYQCHVNFKPQNRRKRSVIRTDPIRIVELAVVLPGGAVPFEAGVGLAATLIVLLFLQIWE